MEMKLELVPVPVSDVDRAKSFYVDQAGFVAEHDHQFSDEIRFVQLTPPGSACSIVIGDGITKTPPGSSEGMLLVVEDIEAVRGELVERGVEVSEAQTMGWGAIHASFHDPDGNRWELQQPAR